MKKLFSLLLVAVMLFGMATTAFAYTDVTATAQTGPVEKLNALGILKGYADGTFKPENPITRAEFAAVIVRAMGLESAAQLINNPTKFSDVTANYAWAYGYINIASAKGIIKGDPNGKFRPGDKVSFAEVVTMVLRAGGWDAACSTMDWPAGFVMKAVEFDLTDNVTFDANAAANRGAVAVMVYNALGMPMAAWNDTTKTWDQSATLFAAKYLNAVEKTVTVTATNLINSSIAVGKVVTAEDGTMTAPTGIDLNALLGREVDAIKVGSAYVYMKDAEPTDRILTGTVKTDYAVGAKAITVKTSSTDTVGTTKTFALDGSNNLATTLVRNNVPVTAAVVAPATTTDYVAQAFKAGDTVNVYLNAAGNVRFIVATSYSTWLRVTGIETKAVNGADKIVVGTDKYAVASNTTFMRDGKVAAFADVKAGDIVYIAATGVSPAFSAYSVDAYSTTANGAIGTIAFNAANELTVTIGTTVYPIATGAKLSVNGGTAVALDTSSIVPVINYVGTASLTKDGKVAYLKANTTALIGYYVSKNTTDGSTVTFAIRGTSNTYNVASGYKATVLAATYSTSSLYQLTQTADGNISVISAALTKNANYKVLGVDTANKIVTLGASGGSGAVSTINFNDATFGVIGATWGNVTNITVGSIIAYVDDGAGTMKYYETYTATPGSASGRLLGFVTNADTSVTVYIEAKGSVVSYTSNTGWTDADLIPGNINKIFDLHLTGGKVDGAAQVAWSASYEVVSISGTVYTLSDGGTPVILSAEDFATASVYLADGTAKTAADIAVGDSVRIVKPTTTVTFVELTPAP